jgi:glycerophosphoryl diester phosphodiesterase
MRTGTAMLLAATSVAALAACSAASEKPVPPPIRSTVSWGDVTAPIVVGHRGSANIVAPENTLAAFDAAVAAGAAIETDVRRTADRGFVLMHDVTVDRTTGVFGEVGSLSTSAVRKLDAARAFHPEVFSPQPVPLFSEYLDGYGIESLLLPEVKGAAEDGTAVARIVLAAGLTSSVLIQSRDPLVLQRVREVEPAIRTALTSSEQVSPEDAVAVNAWAVLVSHVRVDRAYVERMHCAGVKVFAWTVNTLSAAERLLDDGVDGLLTDDPELLNQAHRRTPLGTTDVPIPSEFPGFGWRPYASDATAAPATVDGFVTFAPADAVGSGTLWLLYLPGIRFASVPDPQITAVTLRVQRLPATGDTTRHLGVRFCWTSDDDYALLGGATTRGYMFKYRIDGTAELLRVTGGTAAVLARAEWPPLSLYAVVQLRIEVTGSGISVTRTDPEAVLSADDAVVPRGGFVSVYGSGVTPAVGPAAITY